MHPKARHLARLHAAVAAVCPIDSAEVAGPADAPAGAYQPRPEATAAQRLAADAAVATFDWTDAAQAQWEADRNPERRDLRADADAALAAIEEYLLTADAATAAQVRSQVKLLSRVCRRLLRRVVQID